MSIKTSLKEKQALFTYRFEQGTFNDVVKVLQADRSEVFVEFTEKQMGVLKTLGFNPSMYEKGPYQRYFDNNSYFKEFFTDDLDNWE